MKTSAMVLALLFAGSVEAINYRPYVDGRTPWYKTFPAAPEIGFKNGYKVPDFGVDTDIKSSLSHTAAAESRLGAWNNAAAAPPAPPPRDYFVPNFGEDQDIKTTKQHTAAAEANLGHVMAASFTSPAPPPQNYFVPNFGQDWDIKETLKHAGAAEGKYGKFIGAKSTAPPRDYFVPNFGEDSDVKNTKAHTAAAEASLGHVMQASFAQPEGPPVNYFVPHYGQDHDIKDSLKNAALVESRLGPWVGAGKAPADPPRDYFVPNFGPDQDIKDSLAHTHASESMKGHRINPNNLVQQPNQMVQSQVDLHLESDPICSSAGCTQYKHKKKERGYKINYAVPNFGVDTDITDNAASLALSESAYSHKLEMATAKSKAKWANPAKDVDYNFAPKLEGDMISTAKNLADAQSSLGHKWVICEGNDCA